MRPKEGSRKAVVFDAFHAGGLESAYKVAAKLKLKSGTVKTWAAKWGRTSSEVSARKPGSPIEPHYDYDTQGRAESAMKMRAKHSGMEPDVFSVKERGGKFGIVPAHLDPDRKPGTFKKGDTVRDRTILQNVGTVINAGPEVCEVKFQIGTRNIPNYYLLHADDKDKGRAITTPTGRVLKKAKPDGRAAMRDNLERRSKTKTASPKDFVAAVVAKAKAKRRA